MALKFKNNSGTFYTQAMFFETSMPPREACVYTLKRDDHNGYPSIRRLFLECMDPVGYLFAETHLGGWDHLQKLLELDWFREHWDAWQIELETKIRAQALQKLLEGSNDKASKNHADLNKFLLSRGWVTPNEKKRGAPTKAEIRQAAIHLADEHETVLSELARVTERPLN